MKVLVERCSFWPRGSGSFLVSDGVVERVSSDQSMSVSSDALRLDAGGGTVLPGLVDSHLHPFELGWLRRNIDLRGTANITAVRARLASRAHRAQPGEWLVGMGWDHEAFTERRLPDRSDIDDLTPANPVILSRVCGHIGIVNTLAIQLLGIEGRSGSEYERDGTGRLTGIIKERALVEAYSRVPGNTAADCMADLSVVEYEAAKAGLTKLHTIVSPDNYGEELEALAALATEGRLLLEHRAYVPWEALEFIGAKGLDTRLRGTRARINGVKLFADGSLGAKTAALREPYSDDPANSGLLRYSDEELTGLAAKADALGRQVIIHAIGDRAVEQAVEALSALTGGGNPRRHRVEHASLLPRDLMAKLRKHDIRVSVQPGFVVSDTWAEQRLGQERVKDLYPFSSMLAGGLVVSGSSDAPVESMSPILGMWAAMAGGPEGRTERLNLGQAVSVYTANGGENGLDPTGLSLMPGVRANLTLLDSDVTEMHPALLRKVGVAATLVAGSLVYNSLG